MIMLPIFSHALIEYSVLIPCSKENVHHIDCILKNITYPPTFLALIFEGPLLIINYSINKSIYAPSQLILYLFV